MQTTAAAQPRIVSSGSLVTNINGIPCLDFDGTDDFLVSTATLADFADAQDYSRPLDSPPETSNSATDFSGGKPIVMDVAGNWGGSFGLNGDFTAVQWTGAVSNDATFAASNNTTYVTIVYENSENDQVSVQLDYGAVFGQLRQRIWDIEPR